MEGLGFIDDRSLWLGSAGSNLDLVVALERSGFFDEAFNFSLSWPNTR